MIEIKIDDREVLAVLGRLNAAVGAHGLQPAMLRIGEHLVETTKQRFDTSTGPDGTRWKSNARSTIEAGLGKRSESFSKKTGRITAKGSRRAAGKKPLVDTGVLQDTIRHQLITGGVMVGTNRFADEWAGGAAVHQFGSRNGKIPARPFLGIDERDKTALLGILEYHSTRALAR